MHQTIELTVARSMGMVVGGSFTMGGKHFIVTSSTATCLTCRRYGWWERTRDWIVFKWRSLRRFGDQ